MYSHRTGLTLGFHGCDRSVAQSVFRGESELKTSMNSYDWLGHGIYFWEYSPKRALDFAIELASHPRSGSSIKDPAIIGAVIDLGTCLDLLDFENLSIVKAAYNVLEESARNSGFAIPVNKGSKGTKDLLLRELDCAVLETVHKVNLEKGKTLKFDSVRGVFFEGKELYPNSGFREKDHIQICIRNPNCIKGYFLPRDLSPKFSRI